MNAIYNNQNIVVEYLVNLDDLDINAQNDNGQTILHLCVEYSNIDAIDIILQNTSIDKTIEDNEGYTAKEYAIFLNMNEYAIKLE